MYQHACGRLGLDPALFWRLTVRELGLIGQGYLERRRERQKDGATLAWIAGWVQASAWSEDGMVTLRKVTGLFETEEEREETIATTALEWAALVNATIDRAPDGGQ